MKSATKSQYAQVLAWLIWVIVLVILIRVPESRLDGATSELPALTGGSTASWRDGALFQWKYRLRVVIRRRRRALHRTCQRVLWATRLVKLALRGALTMAQVVDWLTRSQLRRHLGALPVLYSLLEVLQVRDIINRHCPTAAEVDHGTVALVLLLNRLVAPRPLYRVADWLARTVLVYQLGVPAQKFNDDRLGRTLDALSQHSRAIWQDIVHQALLRADIDLSVIFYDLTAFVVHGEYTHSAHVDFGFAHNTPMDKRKFKTGLNVSADGNIPLEYRLWAGRTADLATVQENMERLCQLLQSCGRSVQEIVIIGDRANLNDELALAYDDHRLRYLAGLQPHQKAHRELLVAYPDQQFYARPLNDQRGCQGYWGRPCPVTFEHEGRQVTHQGLVVLSGPMRSALRKGRATQLRAVRQALAAVQAKIGKPWYRTVAAVQQRANTVLKHSPVGKFMYAEAYTDAHGHIRLRWGIDRYALLLAMRQDGRYLLVTNDGSLSPQRMFDRYREKDGVEKDFRIAKSDLQVSPIYLHKDARIEGMLLINMLALLTYSLLERQVRQSGWPMTTRRVIRTLESLDIIETWCWDGSVLYRLVPVDEEQAALLEVLAQVLTELRRPRWAHSLLPSGNALPLALPPPATGCRHAALEGAA
jgi:transposase